MERCDGAERKQEPEYHVLQQPAILSIPSAQRRLATPAGLRTVQLPPGTHDLPCHHLLRVRRRPADDARFARHNGLSHSHKLILVHCRRDGQRRAPLPPPSPPTAQALRTAGELGCGLVSIKHQTNGKRIHHRVDGSLVHKSHPRDRLGVR